MMAATIAKNIVETTIFVLYSALVTLAFSSLSCGVLFAVLLPDNWATFFVE